MASAALATHQHHRQLRAVSLHEHAVKGQRTETCHHVLHRLASHGTHAHASGDQIVNADPLRRSLWLCGPARILVHMVWMHSDHQFAQVCRRTQQQPCSKIQTCTNTPRTAPRRQPIWSRGEDGLTTPSSCEQNQFDIPTNVNIEHRSTNIEL